MTMLWRAAPVSWFNVWPDDFGFAKLALDDAEPMVPLSRHFGLVGAVLVHLARLLRVRWPYAARHRVTVGACAGSGQSIPRGKAEGRIPGPIAGGQVQFLVGFTLIAPVAIATQKRVSQWENLSDHGVGLAGTWHLAAYRSARRCAHIGTKLSCIIAWFRNGAVALGQAGLSACAGLAWPWHLYRVAPDQMRLK